MLRVRVLSFFVSLLYASGLWYSIDRFVYGFMHGNLTWMFPVMLCSSLTISGIMLFLLTLFALKPEPDGTFVIDSTTRYGKLFLFVRDYLERDSHADDTYKTSASHDSLCKTFRKTNLVLFAGTVLVSILALVLVLIFKEPLETLLALGIITGALALGFLPRIMFEKLNFRLGFETHKVIFLLWFSVVFGLVWFTSGLTSVLIFLLVVVGSIFALAVIIAAGFLTVIAMRYIDQAFSAFSGTQLGLLYQKYLCPRLRVQETVSEKQE